MKAAIAFKTQSEPRPRDEPFPYPVGCIDFLKELLILCCIPVFIVRGILHGTAVGFEAGLEHVLKLHRKAKKHES